jgi:hypothetical protein
MASEPSPHDNDDIALPVGDRNVAFDNAYKSFYESLDEKNQMSFAPCASAEDLTDGLEKLSSLARLYQKKSFLLRISAFAESLQPYLNIVDIMIQSNPQYTALVWGALRFIFQVRIQRSQNFN